MKKSTDRILFDTNVLLDAMLERPPRHVAASLLISAAERGRLAGFVAGTSLTTCHSIVQKSAGRENALAAVRMILQIFEVAPIDGRVLRGAADLPFKDFEDAVLHEAARMVSATAIVTSNIGDFEAAELPVVTPEQLVSSLG